MKTVFKWIGIGLGSLVGLILLHREGFSLGRAAELSADQPAGTIPDEEIASSIAENPAK